MAKRKITPPPGPPTNPGHPDEVPLNEDETRFVEEYLIDRNTTRAYRTIFPDVGYATARRRGQEMRNRPHVDREIRAAVHAQTVRTRVSADMALQEIARVAFSDIYELYDPHTHRLRDPRHIPYETRKAISSIKVSRERRTVTSSGRTRTTVTETTLGYTFWPKMDALSKLCRHLGLDTEITPLEALLNALPAQLAAAVREALANPRKVELPSTNGHTPQPSTS